jgi:hypothetical protein
VRRPRRPRDRPSGPEPVIPGPCAAVISSSTLAAAPENLHLLDEIEISSVNAVFADRHIRNGTVDCLAGAAIDNRLPVGGDTVSLCEENGFVTVRA